MIYRYLCGWQKIYWIMARKYHIWAVIKARHRSTA